MVCVCVCLGVVRVSYQSMCDKTLRDKTDQELGQRIRLFNGMKLKKEKRTLTNYMYYDYIWTVCMHCTKSLKNNTDQT